MLEGIVKTITNKNYGFIRSKNKDYFFHKDDLNAVDWHTINNDFNMKKEIKVLFEVIESPKGLRAGSITII